MAYTNIDDPSAYFQTAVYAGNGGTQSITNDGNSDLQPDWVWIKNRTTAYQHQVYDTSRGATKKIMPSKTNGETTDTSALTAFNTDGFSVGSNVGINQNSANQVAWQWKANGGTTASNSDGSVTSTVQANQDAGFSIVTFTSASSGVFSVGHGLGVLPAMIIVKNREAASQWRVWNKNLSNLVTSVVSLNRTDAEENYTEFWGAGVTSSVFGSKTGMSVDASEPYLAYCFAEKQGYSKFGKYVGNANASGPFIYTGFKPAFVMIKPATQVEEWAMIDTKRNPFNQAMKQLKANSNAAEYDGASVTNGIDILSNGFKVRTSRTEINTINATYIYMAFAENPFTTSTGIPTTAR